MTNRITNHDTAASTDNEYTETVTLPVSEVRQIKAQIKKDVLEAHYDRADDYDAHVKLGKLMVTESALDSSRKEKCKSAYDREYTYHLTPEQAQNLKEYISLLREKRRKKDAE